MERSPRTWRDLIARLIVLERRDRVRWKVDFVQDADPRERQRLAERGVRFVITPMPRACYPLCGLFGGAETPVAVNLAECRWDWFRRSPGGGVDLGALSKLWILAAGPLPRGRGDDPGGPR